MPPSDSGCLDGGKLPDAGIIVGDGNLNQEKERLGLGIVVLLQLRRDRLNLFGVGWKSILLEPARCCRVGMLSFEKHEVLTDLAGLQQLDKLLLVHFDGGTRLYELPRSKRIF